MCICVCVCCLQRPHFYCFNVADTASLSFLQPCAVMSSKLSERRPIMSIMGRVDSTVVLTFWHQLDFSYEAYISNHFTKRRLMQMIRITFITVETSTNNRYLHVSDFLKRNKMEQTTPTVPEEYRRIKIIPCLSLLIVKFI